MPELVHREPSWIDDAPVHVEEPITVDAPPAPLVRSMAESVRLTPVDGGQQTQLVHRQGLEAPQPWLAGALGLSWRYAEWGLRKALPALAARAEQLASLG